MPKKRAPNYDTKPRVPTHPSLSSDKPRDASHSLTSQGTPTGNSVNDQIQKLRLSETPSAGSRAASDAFSPSSNPSLPPSLRNILQIPDAPPPRPRPGLRVTRGRRGPAGPAAPQSWLGTGSERMRTSAHISSAAISGEHIQIQPLPGAYLPEDGSLLATTLKALAKDWDWHREYDQYHIATIAVRYKESLLHYIALHGGNGINIDRSGLELLFQNEYELEDATGTEGLTHLDLSKSIGNPLKLFDLKTLLSTKHHHTGDIDLSTDNKSNSPPESWDDSTTTVLRTPSPSTPFSTLTHLSLSHPSPNTVAPWRGLLSLVPTVPTLTHLSLAHWHVPNLTPNSTTAYLSTPSGRVAYSPTTYYSHSLGEDWSEATSLLRRLCKATYCLQWLDLSGCWPWIQALKDLEAGYWVGAWGGLEVVKVTHGWTPEILRQIEGNNFTAVKEKARRGNSMAERVQQFAEKMREIMEDEAKEGVTMANWAHVEGQILFLERTVRNVIRRADVGFEKASEGYGTRGDGAREVMDLYWARGAAGQREALSNMPMSKGSRKARIVFDRGWDEDWVRSKTSDDFVDSILMY